MKICFLKQISRYEKNEILCDKMLPRKFKIIECLNGKILAGSHFSVFYFQFFWGAFCHSCKFGLLKSAYKNLRYIDSLYDPFQEKIISPLRRAILPFFLTLTDFGKNCLVLTKNAFSKIVLMQVDIFPPSKILLDVSTFKIDASYWKKWCW